MQGTIWKAVSVATVLLIGAAGLPRAAEAQAHGTLQAAATVVDTRTSVASLAAARHVVEAAVSPSSSVPVAAPTVAQVSARRDETQGSALIVTIDYARN